MKDEINKIIQSISDFYKLDNALKYYLDRHKAQILLDYITNLQEENKELKKKITFNEKSRRKMQQSLMVQIDKYKNVIDKIKGIIEDNYTNTQKIIKIDVLVKSLLEEVE